MAREQRLPDMEAVLDTQNYVFNAATLKLQDFANEVLRVIFDIEFLQRYMGNKKLGPDAFVITSSRRPTLCLEVYARVPPNQSRKIRTYNFQSHSTFQSKLSLYAKHLDKADDLQFNRPWDVAVQLIMKVECVPEKSIEHPKTMLLRRESQVLKHMWDTFVNGKKGLQSMMGFPMHFDYHEVRHPAYMTQNIKGFVEINMYGEMKQLVGTHGSDGITRIKYMTIEKMGPTLEYLLELRGAALMACRTFDLATAFKIFDQIMCRLIQLHNRHIIYGNLGTKTLSFGREICYNILYLNNFSKAIVIRSEPHKIAHSHLLSNIRYASASEIDHKPKHPFQDVESAFYVLVGMVANHLPWDEVNKKQKNTMDLLEDEEDNADEGQQDLEKAKKVKKMKDELWSNERPKSLDVIFADIRACCAKISDQRVSYMELFITAITNMHAVIREMIQTYTKPEAQPHSFCVHTNNTVSNEFQYYQRLRKMTVSVFTFKNLGAMFQSNGYKPKPKKDTKDKQLQPPAWDTANWCFLYLKIMIPPQKN